MKGFSLKRMALKVAEKYSVRRRDRASFSPEILQAGAVKGLIQYCCTVLYSVLCDYLQCLDILVARAVKGLIQYCYTVVYSVFYDCVQYLQRRFKSRAAMLTGTVILIVQQVKYFSIRSTPVLPQ